MKVDDQVDPLTFRFSVLHATSLCINIRMEGMKWKGVCGMWDYVWSIVEILWYILGK